MAEPNNINNILASIECLNIVVTQLQTYDANNLSTLQLVTASMDSTIKSMEQLTISIESLKQSSQTINQGINFISVLTDHYQTFNQASP